MKRVINIIVYIILMIIMLLVVKYNPYFNDIIKEKNINSNKTFEKYYNKSKYVCIDLKDSKMTRFKEKKQGIIYISTYSNKNFITILTEGIVLNDKVCGEIKNSDNLSNEIKTTIESEEDIKLLNKYFTNYNVNKSKNIYKYLLSALIVLFFLSGILIIINFVLLLRKKY